MDVGIDDLMVSFGRSAMLKKRAVYDSVDNPEELENQLLQSLFRQEELDTWGIARARAQSNQLLLSQNDERFRSCQLSDCYSKSLARRLSDECAEFCKVKEEEGELEHVEGEEKMLEAETEELISEETAVAEEVATDVGAMTDVAVSEVGVAASESEFVADSVATAGAEAGADIGLDFLLLLCLE
eukprot:TRINITY_DN59332_c0_g1_i1.p2 TRINITY_DN59332_c0_g1~~TRINITY_DN59332_c0_g1_i1.p2  ORF type:complete len:185 (-),score=50.94 TRINITY_DN59332_c0_g1_i1:107-661(-)